jgi:DNA-binding winged helix-turn-helix (wHTH) protein
MAADLTAFYEFGPFRLDPQARSLLRDGGHIPLTPRTFDTLLVLIRNRDRVVEKQELMDTLWPDSDVEENNLSQSISAVRKALGERPGEQRYIKTITRRGYRFVAPVREVASDGAGVAEGGENPSPLIIDEEPSPATKRGDEPSPVPIAPRTSTRSGGNERRLSKRVLTVVAVLGICAAVGFVVLKMVKRPEEHTNPSAERIVGSTPQGEKIEVDVWWPKDGVRVSGMQPFKAIATNLSLPEYTMYWQVDGDRLNPLANNYEEYPHKEVLVDLSGWRWRGSGPYKVNFVAKDTNGKTIAEREVGVYISP